mgnify:CR=1 FL=1
MTWRTGKRGLNGGIRTILIVWPANRPPRRLLNPRPPLCSDLSLSATIERHSVGRCRRQPTRSRLGRLAFAAKFFGGKVGKSWWRIWTRGKSVDLPVWQRPGAMLVSLGFYGVGLAGEIKSALTRSFEPLPPPRARA